MLPQGLLKEYSRFIAFALRSLDVLAMVISGFLAFFYKFGETNMPLHYTIALCIGAFFILIVFPFFHVYDSMRGQGFWSTLTKLFQSIVVILILLAGLAFITKTGEDFSRVWFALWGVIAFLFFILFRCGLLIILRLMRARGWNERRVVLLGDSDIGMKLANTIQQSLWTGFRIVDIQKNPDPEKLMTYLASLPESIDEVWIAFPLSAEARVKEILHELRHQTVTIRFVLDIFGMDLLNHSISDFAGFPMLNLHSSPMIGMNRIVKAIEDRVLASLILLLISPLFLMIALAVKFSSKGPVFYKQKRVSWNGKEFDMLKFRTMPVDAESQTGPV